MNLNKMTIEDIQVTGKKVLVRCDFNVPLDADKNITDETRINAALPTIKYLLDNGAAVILCSHLGRPKGEFNMKYSLAPVAKRLSEKLGFEVKLAKDVIGEDAKKLAAEVEPGKAILLENVRFHAEEEKNDPEFAKELASMAELYVSDAFGTVHRAHASTAGVAAYLPAVAGFLIGKELEFLGNAVENPVRPFVAILGGAKVKDKIGVIKSLLNKVDTLVIGGGMSYTFQVALGGKVGRSLLDEERIGLAAELMEKAKAKASSCCCPSTTWPATISPTTASASLHIPATFPMLSKAWTSVPRPLLCSLRKSRRPAPSFGTDPWAASKCPTSQRALWPSHRLWQSPMQPPSSAAATAQQQLPRWVLLTA